MAPVPGPGGASAITAVRGPVPVGGVGVVLAAESLLRAPERPRGNAGIPASEAAFLRAPVTIEMLGRLLMGAENLEDLTLGETEATAALHRFRAAAVLTALAPPGSSGSDDGVRLIVSLADRNATASGDALARLSAATDVAIVRGTDGSRADDRTAGERTAPEDPESVGLRILEELGAPDHPAGVVGAIPIDDARADVGHDGAAVDRGSALVRAAAEAARQTGSALALDLSGVAGAPCSASTAPALGPILDRALAAVDSAGLPRDRVLLTGVAAAVAGRTGIDRARFDALLGRGTALCFDDLGRIPNVRTVVSDHDVALAILGAAERGAQDRILLSCGIRNRHRLTAFGGNGLEFTVEQFLPYLSMLGADDSLLRAVGGANAARILARTVPQEIR